MRGSIRASRRVKAMDAIKRYFRSPAAVAGLILLLIVIAMAISAGFLYPRDPLALAGRPLIWPFSNPRFLLGTDNSGRDIAAQIFYGARISLLIGGVATAIAILIGILVGAFAGYYGGWVDNVLMRITEAFQTLPNFVLLLVLVAVFGSTLTTVTIAVGVVSWPAPAADPRGIPLAAQPRIRPGRPDAGHEKHPAHLWRDPAQRPAAGDRLRQRGDGSLDTP
jgi:ABC-type dipeptide/oligopeptide/nickel transport system permease subunit